MIGVGIIGAGHFGAVHARAMAEVEGVRLVASCREDRTAAAAFAAEHGGSATRLAGLVEDRPWMRFIATPHTCMKKSPSEPRRPASISCWKSPWRQRLRAACHQRRCSTQAGCKLMIGHVMHFALPCLMAKEMVEDGVAGPARAGVELDDQALDGEQPAALAPQCANRRGHVDDGRYPRPRPVVWLMGEPVAASAP